MPTDPNSAPSLTPDDIKKLTSDLSAEIDQEIKKQLAQPHPFNDTQEKVEEVVKQAKEIKTTPRSEPETVETNPGTQASSSSVQTTIEGANLSPTPPETKVTLNPDPLQASVSSALSSLKEGDKISDEWVLKKIYSTSFGHNQSFFYELENESGAKWTLSSEEMKNLVKANVTNQPPQNLAPTQTETQSPTIKKAETAIEKEPQTTTLKPTEVETKPETKNNEKTNTSSELSKEQIEFLNKLHADNKLWQVFNSFSSEQLTKIQAMYESGQLLQFGIDAHPLLDKISTEKLGKEVEIKSGDSFQSLLQNEGHLLKHNNEDSVVIGLHILANTKLLSEVAKKAETAGLLVNKVSNPKEIINQIKDGLAGDKEIYSKLLGSLALLPLNTKFRILSTSEVDGFQKYFVS